MLSSLLCLFQMDRTYQMKSDALVNRERNAIERLQKQQEASGGHISRHSAVLVGHF